VTTEERVAMIVQASLYGLSECGNFDDKRACLESAVLAAMEAGRKEGQLAECREWEDETMKHQDCTHRYCYHAGAHGDCDYTCEQNVLLAMRAREKYQPQLDFQI